MSVATGDINTAFNMLGWPEIDEPIGDVEDQWDPLKPEVYGPCPEEAVLPYVLWQELGTANMTEERASTEAWLALNHRQLAEKHKDKITVPCAGG